MEEVYSPGIYPVKYIGDKEIPFRAAPHARKKITVKPGDIVLVDHVTAVLLDRKAEYKKLDEGDYSVKIAMTAKGKAKAKEAEEEAKAKEAEEAAKAAEEEAKAKEAEEAAKATAKNPQASRTTRR